MSKFLNGIHVPHRKNTLGSTPRRMDLPARVTIPMSMHIGAPAIPVVKVGDEVFVGTLIGRASGNISSPVHASVSGKVLKITELLSAGGKKLPAVIIESDGNMTPDPALKVPTVTSRDAFVDAIFESGIVGLGGAGFPTWAKWKIDPDAVEELIINGAECEPYITSDTYTMTERTADMALALSHFKNFFPLRRIIVGVESHNKAAIISMKAFCAENGVELRVLPSVYPQGGEKVLVYHTTGKVVPMGRLPIDVGTVVCNCTTLAAIGDYLRTGMPLVEKCVTVDGGAVREPSNIIAPIGTAAADLIAACGGLSEEPKKLLYGGPMMGVSVTGMDAPIMKNSNAILALTEKEARLPKTTNCIRCGKCTNTCPFGLAPAAIAAAHRKKDAARLEALNVNACMECGCCSFVCPANRPLVQTNKLAKAFLKEEKEGK